MTIPPSAHKERFTIREYEAGPGGTVPAWNLCNLMQEAAGNHAVLLGVGVEKLRERDLAWNLARLRLALDGRVRARDEVLLATWPSGTNRAYAFREFRLMDGRGNLFGRGSSAWIILDLKQRRLAAAPDFVKENLPPRDKESERFVSRKFPPLDRPARETGYDVRLADLDVNGHANNSVYVQWVAQEGLALAPQGSELEDLDIAFKGECLPGDGVVLASQPLAQDSASPGSVNILHRLLRKSDGREAALAVTAWRIK